MTDVIVFCGGLRRLSLFIIRHFVPQTEECRPGRCGRAGRFRARGRKARRHFDVMLFGFGARHRRRQHRAGVVIPAPRACK